MAEKRVVPAIRFAGFTDAWAQRELGDIGSTYTGLARKTKEDFGHGGGRFVTYMNVFSNPLSDITVVEPIEIDQSQNEVKFGDVFFTTSSETPEEVGMSSVWLGDGTNTYLNSFCFGFRPTDKIDPYYLAYMLRSEDVRRKITFLAQGISRYNISKSKMMDIEISIPKAEEQGLLGTFFYSFDHLITHYQRKQEKLQTIKKSMLEKLFPQEGALVPTVRFAGFTDAWEQRKAAELFLSTTDKGHPELPVLSATQDRGMVRRDENSIHVFHNKGSEVEYKRVLPGQFVIHLRSFQGGFAHSCIEGITSPAYTVFGFREPQKHNDVFWKYIFSSEAFIKRLETVTYGIRDGRSISYDEFLTMSFRVPSYREQSEIANYLTQLDHLITLHQRKLEKLQSLKKSMLGKMFV